MIFCEDGSTLHRYNSTYLECIRQGAEMAGHSRYESRVHPPSLPPFDFQNGGQRIKNEHVIGKATGALIFPLCFCGLVNIKCHHSKTCCGCLCRNRPNDPVKIRCISIVFVKLRCLPFERYSP